MLTLRLPPSLDKSLAKQARAARQTKSAYVRAAVAERIAEAEDYRIAIARLRRVKSGKSLTYTAEEIKRDLGLAV